MSNLIEKYKATQRRLRKYMDPYTAELCPPCPEPCCIKPTKVSEFDVLLANACGCRLPSANESAARMIDAGIEMLRGNVTERSTEKCDYLNPDSCAFPGDLRPFECVRYICPYMKKAMSPGEMREVRMLLHKLGVLHREIREAITPRRRG